MFALIRNWINRPIIERINQLEEIMAGKFDTVESLITAINTETNRIAGIISGAIDGISSGDSDTAITQLQAAVTQLQAIGATPSNPIPTPPATT